jgi:hypothetical protein
MCLTYIVRDPEHKLSLSSGVIDGNSDNDPSCGLP